MARPTTYAQAALASLALASCVVPEPEIASTVTTDTLFTADLAANDGMVIGEMHGTQEAPSAVAQLISALPGRSLVALEQSGEISQLDCNGSALPESWMQPDQDGRSSIAMREMICDLRALEAAGQIDLIFIDDRSATNPRFYRPAADRIAAAMATGEYDQFIAFTGNFHSSNAEEFLPDLLRQNGLSTLSVTTSWPAGSAWNCSHGADGHTCRAREASFDACPIPEGTAHPEVWGWQHYERAPQQWDRCLVLPSTTASPPAHAG